MAVPLGLVEWHCQVNKKFFDEVFLDEALQICATNSSLPDMNTLALVSVYKISLAKKLFILKN